MRSPFFETGYVASAHGLSGEVQVRTFDPQSQTLFEVKRALLRLRGGEELHVQIQEARASNKGVLLRFEGIHGRTRAEQLVGSTVQVYREDVQPPGEGEYFQGDLLGLTAKDESGRELGKVEQIWETGPVPNLVIRSGDSELIVPFAEPFVPAVDLERGEITIRPPEYTE